MCTCGSWVYDPQSCVDYKLSTSPDDWTNKVSWTSMGWFVKLGWIVLKAKPVSSSWSPFSVKNPALRTPNPHPDAFSAIFKDIFEEAFGPAAEDLLAWLKMISVLNPFLSFPGERDRTNYKDEHLESRAHSSKSQIPTSVRIFIRPVSFYA